MNASLHRFRPPAAPGPMAQEPGTGAVLRAPAIHGELTIGIVDSVVGWKLLARSWARLVEHTAAATVFQSYEYMSSWWQHFGVAGRLWIVVALKGDTVVAVAPLQLAPTRWLGRKLRCLTFLGQASEIDRPTVLGTDRDPATEGAIADYIFERRAEWDCLVMHEQRPESSFVSAMTLRLRQRGFLVTHAEGPLCARVIVRGNWDDYLAGRSRALRKSLKRKAMALAAVGEVGFEMQDRATAASAFERYLAVERASWKPGAGLGVTKSPKHVAFYRAITCTDSGAQPRFRFLTVGGRTIAASFGLLWRQRFYSLHIAHDAAYADHSPGVLLTARELQHTFAAGDCAIFDFLGGFLTNKRGWATDFDSTLTLYADYPTPAGRLFHWIYFDVKPRFKRACARAGLLEPLLRAKKMLARRFRGLDTWT